MSTALQAIWTSQSLGRFHGQGIFEDIQSPVGEVEGSDPRVIYAANLGWRLDKKCPSGDWTATSDLSLTSATFNNHELPLLKGTSRRLYRSNNRDQDALGFVDTWIVDQPLGYLRGSDALDLWTHLDWSATDHSHGAGVELDWLNQGDAAVWMDEDTLSHRKGPLSGKVTTQWRALGHGWTKVTKSLRLDGGLGVVVVDAPEGEEQTLTLHPDVFGSLSVGF